MDDGILYEYALKEVESNSKISGFWAKALANSNGNADKAKSLYMQYRVDDLKTDFDSLGVDYSSLNLSQLSYCINDKDWRKYKAEEKKRNDQYILNNKNIEKKTKKEEAENKKYRKIGGWLIPFAFFLVIWLFGSFINPLYTVTEGMKVINQLLLFGEKNFVQIIEYEFYLMLAWQFFVFLLGIFFFKKLEGTKSIAVTFFIVAFILSLLNSFWTLGVATYDFNDFKGFELLEHGQLAGAIALPIVTFLLAIISIPYFLKSKRVSKTFINKRYNYEHDKKGIAKRNTDIFIYAAALPIIFLISYHHQKPETLEIAKKEITQAEHYISNEQYSEGVEHYLRAKELGLDQTDRVHIQLTAIANSLLEKKKYQPAEELYLLSEQLSSNVSASSHDIAEKYFENSMYENASQWYQKAVDHGNNEAMFRLGYSYNEIGKHDLAIKYYKKYINYNEEEIALSNLARIYIFEKQDCNNAIKYATKANEINRKYGAAELGYCYENLGQYKMASKYYKVYIEEDPKNTAILWNIALIYSEGKGSVKEDQAIAFKYFLSAARLGYREAMKQVSMRYRYGLGITANMKKSLYWEKRLNN